MDASSKHLNGHPDQLLPVSDRMRDDLELIFHQLPHVTNRYHRNISASTRKCSVCDGDGMAWGSHCPQCDGTGRAYR